ncbi:MAG: LPP20 family lipoprotein [Pseudomonadota bacterium]
MKSPILALIVCMSMLAGCSMFRSRPAQADRVPSGPERVVMVAEPRGPEHIVKLTAVGYGAPASFERNNESQKRLMAMRASKLDALRSLAEQIYGVRITGNSTVASMALQSDGFRVYIDAYIRGARVTNVNQLPDGSYETTMEMEFDENAVRNFMLQARANGYYDGSNGRGSVGPGTAYGASYYYSE